MIRTLLPLPQQLLQLPDGDAECRHWEAALRDYMMAARGTQLRKPTVLGQPLNLARLYSEAVNRGGFSIVCNKRQWKEIGKALGITGTTSLSNLLKSTYEKYLRWLEDEVYAFDSPADPHGLLIQIGQEYKAHVRGPLLGCAHAQPVLNGTAPSQCNTPTGQSPPELLLGLIAQQQIGTSNGLDNQQVTPTAAQAELYLNSAARLAVANSLAQMIGLEQAPAAEQRAAGPQAVPVTVQTFTRPVAPPSAQPPTPTTATIKPMHQQQHSQEDMSTWPETLPTRQHGASTPPELHQPPHRKRRMPLQSSALQLTGANSCAMPASVARWSTQDSTAGDPLVRQIVQLRAPSIPVCKRQKLLVKVPEDIAVQTHHLWVYPHEALPMCPCSQLVGPLQASLDAAYGAGSFWLQVQSRTEAGMTVPFILAVTDSMAHALDWLMQPLNKRKVTILNGMPQLYTVDVPPSSVPLRQALKDLQHHRAVVLVQCATLSAQGIKLLLEQYRDSIGQATSFESVVDVCRVAIDRFEVELSLSTAQPDYAAKRVWSQLAVRLCDEGDVHIVDVYWPAAWAANQPSQPRQAAALPAAASLCQNAAGPPFQAQRSPFRHARAGSPAQHTSHSTSQDTGAGSPAQHTQQRPTSSGEGAQAAGATDRSPTPVKYTLSPVTKTRRPAPKDLVTTPVSKMSNGLINNKGAMPGRQSHPACSSDLTVHHMDEALLRNFMAAAAALQTWKT